MGVRQCKECGVELVRRKHESTARFSKKKYCSDACARKNFKKEGKGWWSMSGSDGWVKGAYKQGLEGSQK